VPGGRVGLPGHDEAVEAAGAEELIVDFVEKGVCSGVVSELLVLIYKVREIKAFPFSLLPMNSSSDLPLSAVHLHRHLDACLDRYGD
jgi:hypothetical protein